MINNFEDENFNDDVIEEVNGEGEDEMNKLQLTLDKNLNFQNKIKILNEMKINNLQEIIDHKIIENGKIQDRFPFSHIPLKQASFGN